MSNITKLPALEHTTKLIGPFRNDEYVLSVDGYQVPLIKAYPMEDGGWAVHLDERFYTELTLEEIEQTGWLLANAMAIAAGYSCFGENCVPSNPYKTQLIGLELET